MKFHSCQNPLTFWQLYTHVETDDGRPVGVILSSAIDCETRPRLVLDYDYHCSKVELTPDDLESIAAYMRAEQTRVSGYPAVPKNYVEIPIKSQRITVRQESPQGAISIRRDSTLVTGETWSDERVVSFEALDESRRLLPAGIDLFRGSFRVPVVSQTKLTESAKCETLNK